MTTSHPFCTCSYGSTRKDERFGSNHSAIVNNLVWLKNLLKLEASVASLIENAASDKSQMSERIEKIESNVVLVKTGLGAKIDNIAVSETFEL